jgi:hypothetical protein
MRVARHEDGTGLSDIYRSEVLDLVEEFEPILQTLKGFYMIPQHGL